MDKPRHTQVFRSWKVERLKQKQREARKTLHKNALPGRKKGS